MKREIICGIYMITSPSGKIYIGQAKNIYARWYLYKNLKCDRQPKLYASLKKHGSDNHKFEIIERCTIEQLNQLEIQYIKFYDTFNTPHGLNLSGGGHNGSHSDETKLKMSKSGLGKKHTEEAKEKNRIAHLNKKQSPETIEKRVSKIRGRKKSIKHIENFIKSRKNNGREWHSEQTKESIRMASRKKSICQIDKHTNEVIAIFPSIKEASRVLNVFASGISGCLRKKVKTAYNYKWRYENDLSITEDDISTSDKMKLSWEKRKNSAEWNSEEEKKKRSNRASIRSKKMWIEKKKSEEWIKKQNENSLIKVKRKEEINSSHRKKCRSEVARIRGVKNWAKLKENPDRLKMVIEKRRLAWINRKESPEWNSDEMIRRRRAVSDNANNAKKIIEQERLIMIF